MRAFYQLDNPEITLEICQANIWTPKYLPAIIHMLQNIESTLDDAKESFLYSLLRASKLHPLMFVNVFNILNEMTSIMSTYSSWAEIGDSALLQFAPYIFEICYQFVSLGLYKFGNDKECFLILESLMSMILNFGSFIDPNNEYQIRFINSLKYWFEYFSSSVTIKNLNLL